MTTWVALVRSVNVGGRNRLPMADFRAALADLGFEDVRTYLQSGNAVFAAGAPARTVTRTIEDRLSSQFGLAVPVVLRSAAQLESVVASTPFAAFVSEPTTVHVTFLSAPPDPGAVAALADRAGSFGDDRLEVVGTEAHLHCPGGYGETTLTNTFVERALGVTATTRNWKSVLALTALATSG